MTTMSSPAPSIRRRPSGPHLGLLAAVSLGLTAASLATSALLTAGDTYVSPFAATAQVVGFYQAHGSAVRVSSMLLFGSAVPLGIFAATAFARLQQLGVRVPGPAIGFYGGITASLMLMLSSMTGWVLGRPEVSGDGALTRALSFLGFLSGGVGYVVGLGLLIAGIAVPALILGLVPRWLAAAGLVLAAACEVSFLAMVIPPVQLLLPVGRYGGLVWLTAAGFLLPTHRRRPQRTQPMTARTGRPTP